jgi:uncharacterized protein (DUF2147 family)
MSIRVILIAALAAAASPATAAAPITGKWLTAGKDSIVEIAPCGPKLCGKISKLLKPVPGGPPVDRNNPDTALRTRPLIGLPILIGFADNGSDWAGTIYDPRRGKTYRSVVAKNPDGTLKVQGCIAFFCQTQVWTAAK